MIASADGCRGGWLVVKSNSWPCEDTPYLAICADFRALVEFTRDCERVVVDIPIGLPAGTQIRSCDVKAKDLLSKDGASSAVFHAPPRETLPAKTPEEFQKLHKEARKKGAGLPVWGILPKIKEADETMTPELQRSVCEFHPELVWLRVAGRYLGSKHEKSGLANRVDVLDAYVPSLKRVLQWKEHLGAAAKLDDTLDAMIGLAAADASLKSRKYKLPQDVTETDTTGLLMEMWY
jgi:predicted RNase H-like nuclease